MARYLGVDGGGSKTAFALIDDAGSVIARATAPTSYYFNDGFEVVEKSLAQGVTDICTQAGIAPATSTRRSSGFPATARPAATSRNSTRFRAACSATTGTAATTTWCAAGPARSAGEDGINVISGTGSMTYGERQGVGAPGRRLG